MRPRRKVRRRVKPRLDVTQVQMVVTIARPETCCMCLQHFDGTATVEMRDLHTMCTSQRHLLWPLDKEQLQADNFIGKYLQTEAKDEQRVCVSCFEQALVQSATASGGGGVYFERGRCKLRCPMCWPERVSALDTTRLDLVDADVAAQLRSAMRTAKRQRRYVTFHCPIDGCTHAEVRSHRFRGDNRVVACPQHGRHCVLCFQLIGDDYALHREICRKYPIDIASFFIAHDLRRCPHCQTPVEKNGGCHQMTCRCRRTFNWNDAQRY